MEKGLWKWSIVIDVSSRGENMMRFTNWARVSSIGFLNVLFFLDGRVDGS